MINDDKCPVHSNNPQLYTDNIAVHVFYFFVIHHYYALNIRKSSRARACVYVSYRYIIRTGYIAANK